MEFNGKLKEYTSAIDKALLGCIGKMKNKHTGGLYDAVEYALFPGGKRVRPLILMGVGGAVPFACAIEMIHAYSLIHDDLPAMDNADFRRGKPSVHKAFGEATAILAGDALLNLAHEVMLEYCANNPEEKNIKAALAISEAAGAMGMIGGQAADLFYEKKAADAEVIEFIHINKTAALFKAAGMDAKIWEGFGRAFQIKDDLENIEGDESSLGKPVGNDAESQKNTYVSVYGVEKARKDLEELVSAGLSALKEMYGGEAFITKFMAMIFGKS